jgi:heme-degrading monooxygenase HmoA
VITRIFRVRVPVELHAEFESKFLSVSVPYVQTAPGLVSVSVGRPTRWVPDEYVMISVWRSEWLSSLPRLGFLRHLTRSTVKII